MTNSFDDLARRLDDELRRLADWTTPAPGAAALAATRRAVQAEVRRLRGGNMQRRLAAGLIAAAAAWLFALAPQVRSAATGFGQLPFDADLDAWAAAFDQSRVALGARLSGYEPAEWEPEGSWYDELELFYNDDESEDAS